MKLEVGMYVRTKNGLIAKYIGLEDFGYNFDSKIYWFYEYYNDYILEEDFEEWLEKKVIKASHNIIDLIEVGDYVNGYMVRGTSVSTLLLDNFNMIKIEDYEIKSIVTKEQFESMSYKVNAE